MLACTDVMSRLTLSAKDAEESGGSGVRHVNLLDSNLVIFVPSHGLQHGLSQVIGGHDNIQRVIRATPGKDGVDFVCGFPLLQRPVTQVNEKLHIREPDLEERMNAPYNVAGPKTSTSVKPPNVLPSL